MGMAFDLTGVLTPGRVWTGVSGPSGTPRKPLVIQNMLTNELWEYHNVESAIDPATGYFDFTDMHPGIYTIRNFADNTLPVLLFGNTFYVGVGQEWRFMVHDEVGSHAGPLASSIGRYLDGNDTRLTQSYWDAALGGSIWDSGASVWDLINA
jgi:hypothetical protein